MDKLGGGTEINQPGREGKSVGAWCLIFCIKKRMRSSPHPETPSTQATAEPVHSRAQGAFLEAHTSAAVPTGNVRRPMTAPLTGTHTVDRQDTALPA